MIAFVLSAVLGAATCTIGSVMALFVIGMLLLFQGVLIFAATGSFEVLGSVFWAAIGYQLGYLGYGLVWFGLLRRP